STASSLPSAIRTASGAPPLEGSRSGAAGSIVGRKAIGHGPAAAIAGIDRRPAPGQQRTQEERMATVEHARARLFYRIDGKADAPPRVPPNSLGSGTGPCEPMLSARGPKSRI